MHGFYGQKRLMAQNYLKGQTGYLPDIGTMKPTPKLFSCSATDYFRKGLIELSEVHAESELFDHFFIYKDTILLLERWDSLSDPLYFSLNLPEKEINNVALRLGLEKILNQKSLRNRLRKH
ncbi:MAG: hypothetical protein ACE5GF_06540 [Thermodesulfobacteriota bacterium]